MSDPISITSTSHFDTLTTSTTFVVVDWYADWCPPCKAIAPLYTKLASSHSVDGKLAFAKINVDNQQALAAQYGITAMPTFMLFRDGQPLASHTVRGANPQAIQAMITEAERELAKLQKESKNQEGEGVESKDNETVSGGYTMSAGTRGDWKMKLTG